MANHSNEPNSGGKSCPAASAEMSLLEGRLFVHTMPEAIAGGLHLRIGDRALPLQPMDESSIATIPKQFTFLPQDVPADVVRITDDVTMTKTPIVESNTTCLQIESGRSDGARYVPVGDPITLPPSSLRYEFRCLLAAEVPDAAMELVISDEHGTRLQSKFVRFDTGRRGGTSRSGYQEVRIPLPPSEAVRIVTLYALLSGSPDDAPPTSGAD